MNEVKFGESMISLVFRRMTHCFVVSLHIVMVEFEVYAGAVEVGIQMKCLTNKCFLRY